MMEALRLLLVCWLLFGLEPVPAQVRHPLPVLWMMPAGSVSGGGNLQAGVATAVRLALEDLKKQAAPLGDYEIQFHELDSQCDSAESIKALFDAMWVEPNYLLLFGGVCPSVTALIARSLPALNLLQVSFSDSSPSLSNRKWYGNLFSTVPSDRVLNQATVKLLQRFKWTRVGVISQEQPRLSEVKKDLSRQLLKADIQVVSSESFSDNVCSSLKRLKERDVRVIIGHFEEESVSEVLCCAYRLNMFGARYQWLVVDGGTSGWRFEKQVPGCTANSLLMAADGSIKMQMRRLGNTKTPGISGRTPQDYQDSYVRRLTQEGSKVSPLHSFAYDAVWVTAKALTQVMEAVKHREKYSSRRNVSLSGEEVQKTLLEAVKQTQFEGVTGSVFFRNGERMAAIDLIQFQGSSGVSVGDFSTSTQQLRLVNHLLKFPGPGPTRDRTLVVVQRQHVSFLLYGIISSAAAGTIFITLALLFFTAICRKHRPLTLSDGSEDELLLLGVLMSSSSILVSGLDGATWSLWTSELLCSVRLWTVSLGHTVGFSVLFIRTWRLHSLCSVRHKPAGRVLLLLLLLDVSLLSTWQTVDPLRRVELQLRPQSVPAQDELVQMFSESCSSSNMQLWIAAVCGSKAPTMALGCLLAWSVRSPGRPQPLTQCVVAVTTFSVSGLLASLLTAHNPPLQLGVSGVLVLCCNLFVLGWLFGPKFLYGDDELGDKEEEEVRGRSLSGLNLQLWSHNAQLDSDIETLRLQLCEATQPKLQRGTRGRDSAGGLRSVTWSHAAQVFSEERSPAWDPLSPDGINSPEHVRRRLSVQLPILHHSYLPAGGVRASSSRMFWDDSYFLFPDQSDGGCDHVTEE
uniref:Gamma-aminobutyric acid type B receptor subunit 2 n=1 Tax=Gasterosteus aculeatus aculeatus TaxID=481459 RepID=G3NF33_GASAC|nr:gamma-aminobutyric acid type B receptor subunit 2-like isoform X2 [Gasterosteus aculeatus aculeatus]